MSSFIGEFLSSFRRASGKIIGSEHDSNSPDDIATRAGGQVVEKTVTLTAAGNPAEVELFAITGGVTLFDLYGIFEDVTNVADIEEVRLGLWDGTNWVDLTLAAGVVCDGATVKALPVLRSSHETP